MVMPIAHFSGYLDNEVYSENNCGKIQRTGVV